MLWLCWLGIRKSIRPIKYWVMRCWRGYLPAVRCRWSAYGSADATATPSSPASLKSRMVPFWCRFTQAVPEKEATKRVPRQGSAGNASRRAEFPPAEEWGSTCEKRRRSRHTEASDRRCHRLGRPHRNTGQPTHTHTHTHTHTPRRHYMYSLQATPLPSTAWFWWKS